MESEDYILHKSFISNPPEHLYIYLDWPVWSYSLFLELFQAEIFRRRVIFSRTVSNRPPRLPSEEI